MCMRAHEYAPLLIVKFYTNNYVTVPQEYMCATLVELISSLA